MSNTALGVYGSLVYGPGASVTNAAGDVYAITANNQISINGVVDPYTSGVEVLTYYDGAVYQKNAAGLWYSQATASLAANTWIDYPAGDTPVPIPTSSNDTVVQGAGSPASITDAAGDKFMINSVGQVTEDGAVVPTTANVIELAYVNGVVWQENSSSLWWEKTATGWGPEGGTSTSPLPPPVVPPPVQTWTDAAANGNAYLPQNWSNDQLPVAGDSLLINSGTGAMNIDGGNLGGDTLQIGSGGGTVVLNTSGATTLHLLMRPGAATDIAIAAGSSLSLTASVTSSNLNISGGTLAFVGASTLDGFTTTISSSMTGTGSVSLLGGNANGETLNLDGAVGSGLTFNVSSMADDTFLQIMKPASFQGTVNLTSGGVEFGGIQATSGELLNGILDLFQGTKLVDAIRFVNSTNGEFGALQLQDSAAGVMISAGGLLPSSTKLPLTIHA